MFSRKKVNIELIKLTVSIAIPVILGVSTYFFQKSLNEQNAAFKTSKEISIMLAKRRVEVFNSIKGPLNEIYSYIEEVGDWERLTVCDVKKSRKNINKIMYSDPALWSTKTFNTYINYMDNVAFEIIESDDPSRIRAEISYSRISSEGWDSDSYIMVTGDKDLAHRLAYRELLSSFAADLTLSSF